MRARKFYEAHFVPVAFEMRERVFGALFAPSAESFTALPFSISISRLQTGQLLRPARMISIREVIVMSVRQ